MSIARKKGFGSLMDSGVTNMLQGMTTPEEVLSVTFSEDIGDIDLEQETPLVEAAD